MIKNQEFVDFVLKTLKDPFNFAGEVKYYPGRALDESSALLFPSDPEFMTFLNNFVPWSQEYVVLSRTPKDIGFSLIDEKIQFTLSSSGIYEMTQYQDPQNIECGDPEIHVEALRRELLDILENYSTDSQCPKKFSA